MQISAGTPKMRPSAARRLAIGLGALLACCCIGSGTPQAAPLIDDDAVYEQRLLYKRSVDALKAGRRSAFRRGMDALADYPLHVYLLYYEAEGHLSTMRPKRARELRRRFADTPLGERFHQRWLRAQALRGRWDVYLEHYEPSGDAAARCNHLRALYRSGAREEALAQVGGIWQSGADSLPKTCDPLFDVWYAAGNPDRETAWARLAAALDAGSRSLANYLLRFFQGADAAAAQSYYEVHWRPRNVRNLDRFPDTDGGRRALAHGLLRYAEDNAGHAQQLWKLARGERSFAPADALEVDERLTVALAESGRLPDADPTGFSADALERICKALVRQQAWPAAARWLAALPPSLGNQPRWRYWRGRALRELGEAEAAERNLRAAAEARHYYGFLAAHALGAEPNLNALPARRDRAALRALLANPAVRRMAELHAVRDLANARREWRRAVRLLEPGEQRALVELTAELGWTSQAIFGAREGELLDMVEFRFPMPFLDVYRRFAFDVNLPASLLLAISRQESAFDPAAISRVGARGLMQLMPATAQAAAERIGALRPTRESLLNPRTNVRLGAHHLALLMDRYNGHRALAAAAYNAGEHRVSRWRRGARGMPTDVWVERIPFRETRDYVKGVIAFHHIYSRLLGNPAPVLGVREERIP